MALQQRKRKGLALCFLVAAALLVVGASAINECSQHNIDVHGFQNNKLSLPTYHYLGSNSQGIITKLYDGHVVVSQDSGVTWTENHQVTINGNPVVSAHGKNVLAVSLSAQNLFQTAHFTEHSAYNGELSNFISVSVHWLPFSFIPHPSDDNAILAIGSTLQCVPQPESAECTYAVYFSNDFGKTWAKVLDYVYGPVFWTTTAVGGNPYGFIAEDYAVKTGPIGNRPPGTKRLVYGDLTAMVNEGIGTPAPQVSVLQEGILGSLLTRGLIFVTKTRPGAPPPLVYLDIVLYTSQNAGATFQLARLPTSHNDGQRFYTILDVSGGSVFVNVLFNATNWGNIYTSDDTGDYYALNLRHGSRAANNQADFAPVHGIDGIYLANIELTPSAAGQDLATRITYDRGGQWYPLNAPASEHCSNPNGDPHACKLHLHAVATSPRNSFYSRQKALGVVIGTGNVGAKLARSQFNTFLSRDAGKTWQRTLNGSHAFALSENGGVLMAVRDDQDTSKIVWTLDEGITWNECLIPSLGSPLQRDQVAQVVDDKHGYDWTSMEAFVASTGPLTIKSNIDKSSQLTSTEESHEYQRNVNTEAAFTAVSLRTVPTQQASARFLLHVRSGLSGSVLHINFNRTAERACQGWEDPSLPSSDYEVWSPTDLDGDGCLLGEKLLYSRRKATAECWIAHMEVPRIVLSVDCKCSRQDYMCDYCFAPNNGNPEVCELECPGYHQAPPATCEGTYHRSIGYRLVAGDNCRNGVDLRGPLVPCPMGPIHPPPVNHPPIHPPPINPPPVHPPPANPPPVHNPPTAIPPQKEAPQHAEPPVTPAPPPPPAPAHSPEVHIPDGIPPEPPLGRPVNKVVVASIIAGMTIVVLIGVVSSLFFLSSRNAQIRYSLLRCIPESWLPAYVPPEREEGPHYHKLQGGTVNTNNDDIFNDDEFLQEDANVLELEDD